MGIYLDNECLLSGQVREKAVVTGVLRAPSFLISNMGRFSKDQRRECYRLVLATEEDCPMEGRGESANAWEALKSRSHRNGVVGL